MMLRLRSRAATLMADRSSQSPPPPKPTDHIPSLTTSPRLRAIFAAGAHSDQPQASPATANSPTSVLRPFSAASAALGSPTPSEPPTKPPCRQSSAAVGLNSLILENSDDDVSNSRPNLTSPRLRAIFAAGAHCNYFPDQPEASPTTVKSPTSVLRPFSPAVGLNSLILENYGDDVSKFRPNLTVRIPVLPDSPTEFGTKTWKSPKPRQRSDQDVSQKCLSAAEMELSEEYTCVISHGPNPTTTHIYDGRVVVESCIFYLSDDYKPTTKVNDHRSSESFLSKCFTCKKSLKQNQDIYIYRGDKAFCSSHCRYQEMVFDGAENEEDI